jgi:hypothetical protein
LQSQDSSAEFTSKSARLLLGVLEFLRFQLSGVFFADDAHGILLICRSTLVKLSAVVAEHLRRHGQIARVGEQSANDIFCGLAMLTY